MGEDLTKLHISHALGERSTRVASHIVETINRVLDLIEEQPTAVIEALIDYAKQKQSQEHRKPRHDLVGALVAYGQATLSVGPTPVANGRIARQLVPTASTRNCSSVVTRQSERQSRNSQSRRCEASLRLFSPGISER